MLWLWGKAAHPHEANRMAIATTKGKCCTEGLSFNLNYASIENNHGRDRRN